MKLFAALAVVTARERTSFNVGSSNNESQFSLVSDGSGNTLEVVNELPIEQYQKKQENEGNDIFYPKRLLKHLASSPYGATQRTLLHYALQLPAEESTSEHNLKYRRASSF